MRLTIAPTFVAALKKLPPDRQRAVKSCLLRFQTEPALPSLHFRPLAGKGGYFIISAAHGDRVILRREDGDAFTAVDVGPHENVYRRWDNPRRR
ncbi:MAG TPA: hypothetical protein VHD15_15760 [Hyphomicrobiales bacterium]|nr:hypothetical protein [Hyphomicrobiales bacterium]